MTTFSSPEIYTPSEDDIHAEVFRAFKAHHTGTRPSSELAILSVLRTQYPSHTVTLTLRQNWDFLAFANAGNAVAVQDSNEELSVVAKAFVPPNRSGGNPDHRRGYHDEFVNGYTVPGLEAENGRGTLENHVRFGRWSYTYKDVPFIIYQVEPGEGRRGYEGLIFLLCPKSTPPNENGVSATDRLILAVGAWSTVLHDELWVFDDGHWAKSEDLWNGCTTSNWDDVILNPDTKASLIADVLGFFDSKDLYNSLSVPWKRGIIFHGVPGNGKTISIKALISALAKRENAIPALYVKALSHYSDDVRSIRTIFTHARTMAPCLLIFEDLDSLVRNRCRSYFLNEVDGLESNEGILMIGSTNHLDSLDPAISKRPSRFDRKYHFRLPEEEERSAYCKYWCTKLVSSPLVEFPQELCPILVRLTEGFSFAYMKELFVVSLLAIARGGTGEEIEEPPVLVNHSEAIEIEHMEFESGLDSDSDSDAEARRRNRSAAIRNRVRKRTMPDVEVPEELKDNLLLRVLKVQLRLLLNEMDNRGDENWAPGRGPRPIYV